MLAMKCLAEEGRSKWVNLLPAIPAKRAQPTPSRSHRRRSSRPPFMELVRIIDVFYNQPWGAFGYQFGSRWSSVVLLGLRNLATCNQHKTPKCTGLHVCGTTAANGHHVSANIIGDPSRGPWRVWAWPR